MYVAERIDFRFGERGVFQELPSQHSFTGKLRMMMHMPLQFHFARFDVNQLEVVTGLIAVLPSKTVKSQFFGCRLIAHPPGTA